MDSLTGNYLPLTSAEIKGLCYQSKLIFILKTRAHVAQADLKFIMYVRMTLSLWFPCLHEIPECWGYRYTSWPFYIVLVFYSAQGVFCVGQAHSQLSYSPQA